MKPNTIYSKSGKGVQEASGKTSLLKRADRAVLSAIDGRATLGEVAQKVGKTFDAEFEKLIAMLDKDGFVREVTAGPSSSSQSRPTVPAVKPAAAKAPAAKPAAPAAAAGGSADDLDFTTIMPAIKRAPAQSAPPKSSAQPDAAAKQRAKEQEAALYKARQEAEARAQSERDRLRQETEAKARAETEAKIRAETEKRVREEAAAKLKADAEAKANAARDAVVMRMAAEAQARIDAERKVREEGERKANEAAEKARREADELRLRLEAERSAREAEEQKRRQDEERRRQEEVERRAAEEAERQQREADERRRREEEDRRLKEKEELAQKAREQEEARVRQAQEMEQARARAGQRKQEEERARRTREETSTRHPTLPAAAAPPPPEPAKAGAGSLDALMADLDSFSQREEEERQAREAADRSVRDDKKRKAQEEAERRVRDQAAQAERERQRAAEDTLRREEEERRAQEDAERRLREVEEQRRLEAEERQRKARELMSARAQARPAAAAPAGDIGVTDDDLGMDDVRRDEAAVAKETRKAQRERERETREREREARAQAAAQRDKPVKYPKARRPVKWGRPVAIVFFSVLVVGIGALHVVPLPMADYEDVASEALGRPVKIGTGRLSLFTGVRLNLEDVTVGDNIRIASAHAYPRIGSLIDDHKAFRRIELDGVTVPQQAIGAVVAAKLRGANFSVGRLLVSNLQLEGPVPLPVFEADAVIGPDGAVRNVTLRGPDSLNARLTPAANGELEFDVTAASVVVPFVPELTLASFAMKGTANRQGMSIASWGGAVLDGALSGTASVRWSGNWQVDGAMTMRGINAAIFAPALLSEGKAEGSGRFSMSGADPAKLHNGTRMEGSFTMGKGMLGTVDLARVLHTSGRQSGGRTQFTEMTGQAVYDRGAIALRNVSINAGALNAGVSADIAPSGALAGRIIADIRTTSTQPLRATLVLGGTVKEPQVRN
jgi:hypothetical protein